MAVTLGRFFPLTFHEVVVDVVQLLRVQLVVLHKVLVHHRRQEIGLVDLVQLCVVPALLRAGGRAFRMSVQSVVRRQVILIVVMIMMLVRMVMVLNVAGHATGRTVRRGGLVRQNAERLLLGR